MNRYVDRLIYFLVVFRSSCCWTWWWSLHWLFSCSSFYLKDHFHIPL